MKKNIPIIKVNNKLIFILLLLLISFILGLLFPAFLSKTNKNIINSSLDNFFLEVSKDKLNYISASISSVTTNIITIFLVWILGISIIGIIFIIAVLFTKSFILGFSVSSILMTYGFRGIILMLIYIIPLIINLLIFVILCYYAISFSLVLFNYIFRKKNYSKRLIVKRYIKVLIISLILIIISSLIEVFIIPNILKIFI